MKHLNIIFILLFTIFGCSGTLKQTKEAKTRTPPPKGHFRFINISKGLPEKGMWRQNIVLYDVNNDGFKDIITPPQRKAEPENKRPFIFIWDDETSEWTESDYKFPKIKGYDYGGVAVGDINNDGLFDIALATHSGRIIVLINNNRGGFKEAGFPSPENFSSRTIELEDMDNDGWPDIVALSEMNEEEGYIPKGLLFGRNLQGKGWDVSLLKEGDNVFGDSMDISDVNNDGNKDIVIAPLLGIKKYKKLIWFGDGKGEFGNAYTADDTLFHRTIPFIAWAGDINGNQKTELLYLNSGIGRGSTTFIDTYIWENNNLKNIASRIIYTDKPVLKFTLFDLDKDNRKELIIVTMSGIHVFNYMDNAWEEIFFQNLDFEKELNGIYNISAAKHKDGSTLIVYNGGNTNSGFKGIRAYLLNRI